jgi:hypothetical protein
MQEMQEVLQGVVQPWYEALANPHAAQQAVLRRLLQGYARTRHGREHGAEAVATVDDYRSAFPAVTYEDIKLLIERTMAGETERLWAGPSRAERPRASPSLSL